MRLLKDMRDSSKTTVRKKAPADDHSHDSCVCLGKDPAIDTTLYDRSSHIKPQTLVVQIWIRRKHKSHISIRSKTQCELQKIIQEQKIFECHQRSIFELRDLVHLSLCKQSSADLYQSKESFTKIDQSCLTINYSTRSIKIIHLKVFVAQVLHQNLQV